MLLVGPNPYGLCCTLGLQGAAEHPKDVWWFLELAETMRARCIEFHFAQLEKLSGEELNQLKARLRQAALTPVISGPAPLATIHQAIPIAKQLGVKTVRTHLTPVLCGARAEQGENWAERVADIRARLPDLGTAFQDAGLTLAVENHQDFGSDELLEFCELGGDSVGITLDTGNPLAVAEEPLAFARKVAHKVRHVHLKDYRAQSTPEGFRLIRCAIGDGAIPFLELEAILNVAGDLTAALEPGALDSRHIRLLTPEWWKGYPERSPSEIQACLDAASVRAVPPEADYRTPWERGDSADAVCQFEMEQMMRSIQNMQRLGWLAE